MPRIEAKRICFIRTSAIGDVVHGLAFMNGLRAGYPDAHITWITQRIPGELIDGHPSFNRLITFNRKMSFTEWFNFIRRIRLDTYDLVIDPQVSFKATLLTLFSRAQTKLGYDFHRTRELNWLATTHRIPRKPLGHVLDNLLEFLDYLGIDYPEPVWNFVMSPAEIAWQDKWKSRFSRPVVGLVPASSTPNKDWAPENYAALADRIDTELNLEPVLICGPGEREQRLAQTIHMTAKSKPTISSEKPIRHTLLQLSASKIVVAPDTGPLHIAVALGIPTVGLYGYSNPRRCGPYKFKDLLIDMFNDPNTEPEPITRKTKPNRMNLITVDMVMERIATAIETY